MKKLAAITWVLVFCLGVVSCAGNREARIRQSAATRNLGESYMMHGKHTAALNEFIKAEALNPEDPYLQYDMGLVYMAKEKLDLAEAHFKKAIALKTGYSAAKNSLGVIHLMRQEWDAAIVVFKETVEDDLYATPQIPLSNLGFAYYNKKDFTEAGKYYLEALKKDPEYVTAWRGLGLTYRAAGQNSNAVKALERAVKLAPDAAELHLELADTYKALGDVNKAKEGYAKVIALDPEGKSGQAAKKAAAGLK
jgi:Tfp pilus assembly protein PilF